MYSLRRVIGWWANIIGIQIEEGIENIVEDTVVEDMVDSRFAVLKSTLCIANVYIATDHPGKNTEHLIQTHSCISL